MEMSRLQFSLLIILGLGKAKFGSIWEIFPDWSFLLKCSSELFSFSHNYHVADIHHCRHSPLFLHLMEQRRHGWLVFGAFHERKSPWKKSKYNPSPTGELVSLLLKSVNFIIQIIVFLILCFKFSFFLLIIF